MNVRTIAFTVLALALSGGIQAQSKGTQDPEMHKQRLAAAQAQQAEERIAGLSRELGLSEEQTKRLRAADERRRKDLSELRADAANTDRAAMSERNRTIMDTFENELRSLMTEEQYAKYTDWSKPKAAPAQQAPAPQQRPTPPAATE